MLLDHFSLDPATVTIIESRNNRERVASSLARGVHYEQLEINRDTLIATLDSHLGPGDLLIDLAWNFDLTELLDWCRDNDVRYLNTSIEVWDPYGDPASTPPQERTLYWRHMALRRQLARWGANDGPSAVVEHGANPGLVSHFTKQALDEIAAAVLVDGRAGERAGARDLSAEERKHAAALMRVNHVGEICAQALYEAQAVATRDEQLRTVFHQAAVEESDHLAWTRGRVEELGDRVSVLVPLGYAGAYSGKHSVRALGSLLNMFVLSMVLVTATNNVFSFLLFWELMSLASFLLVVYEHEKEANLRSGVTYLVMTHQTRSRRPSSFSRAATMAKLAKEMTCRTADLTCLPQPIGDEMAGRD
jgi:demethoxyubiquinone hydroxylase (CLK1/Coq7/Cat5 family)